VLATGVDVPMVKQSPLRDGWRWGRIGEVSEMKDRISAT
jgi:hypothetical protein